MGAGLDLSAPAADGTAAANASLSLLSTVSADPLATPLPPADVSTAAPVQLLAPDSSSPSGATPTAAFTGASGIDLSSSAGVPASAVTSAPAPGAVSGGVVASAPVVGVSTSLAAVAPVGPLAGVVGAQPAAAPLPGGSRTAPTSSAGSSSLGSRLNQLPLSFEANQGQTDARVQFLARGAGYTLFLTPTSAVFSLPVPAATLAPAGTTPAASGMVEALSMDLLGANPAAAVVGQDQLPGRINYFVGNDPAQWHANIPTYGRVAYQGVYPGIDLAYYGHQDQLEYDFIVHPGADPHAVHLGFEGADQLSLDGQGNLVLNTAAGPLVQPAPVVYQEINGVRHAVPGRFVQQAAGQVGFALGAYDATQPLVIDPLVVNYSTYLGGSGNDTALAVAVDGSDHAYVTGSTTSTNFPTTPGAFQTTFRGSGTYSNAFVTKLTADGTGLVYSTYLGGLGSGLPDKGYGIAVDAAGHAYVTGITGASNFPTTPGSFQTTYRDRAGSAFVTELTPDGSGLVYSTFLSGTGQRFGGSDMAYSIAVDAAGHAYVTGFTGSSDFPTTPGAFQATPRTNATFVTELTADGSGLVYSTYLNGSHSDNGYGIAVDAAGHAYVTGEAFSIDFPTTAGAFQTTLGSSLGNAFVSELTADGSGLVYSTFFGGSGSDVGAGIAVDAAGHAYVTGRATSADFPTTPGAFQTSLGTPSGNAFVTQLTPDGSGLVYSTFLGGSGNGSSGDGAGGIAVDAVGRAYVTGSTTSTDFPTTPGAFQTMKHASFSNAFVSVLSPTGANLGYSTYLGGSNGISGDGGNSIAVAPDGSAYVAGFTSSTDFPTKVGSYQTTYHGGLDDAWVASGRIM
jgi:hypothetical protein